MKIKLSWLFLISALVFTVPSDAQQSSPNPRPQIILHAYYPSTTTLSVTSGGYAVTSVDAGSVVTLTASVVANSALALVGPVKFCDASAPYCTDIHLLGTAQLTSGGTAAFSFIPGIGNHSYKAEFSGNYSDAPSASVISDLRVTGQYPTSTAIAQSGVVDNYTLTATVTSIGGTTSPSGEPFFVDTSNLNAILDLSVPLTPQPGVLNWLNSETIWTDPYPRSPVVADFNGDGIPDIALAIGGDNAIDVFLGNGNGTFTATANPLIQDFPGMVAVGDFDGDGTPDLAVPDYGLGGVKIFLNNGDGTLYPVPQTAPTGDSPFSVSVADFNLDGIPDLAVLNICGNDNCATPSSTGTVTILLGNGDGTFTKQAVSPATGVEPESMVVGDFTGDGVADLAVANSFTSTGGSGSNLTILKGNGDGTFTAVGTNPSIGDGFPEMVVGDFNGDGKADLAVTNSSNNTLTILLGKGDGTFTAAASPPTGLVPGAVAVGDFNADGIPDLAVANQLDNTVTILLGKGDGTFTPQAATLATDNQPSAFAVGDFNGDGINDLVVTTYQGDTMAILLSQMTQTATATGTGVSFPANSGTHNIEARYGGDLFHGSSASGLTPLKGQVTPSVTWAAPASISYGTMLSATQLDATSTVAGTFAYTPASGTVLAAGSNTLSVTFTPTDAIDFTTATATVQLTVVKAAPPITWATPAAISFGTALGATQLNASSTVAGVFVYTPASGTVLSAGTHTLSVTLTPADSIDYTTATSTVSLVVNPAPFVSFSAASLVFIGQPVGTTSASQTVTLTNTGGLTLTITSIGVTGANASSFVFANSCGTSLAAGANCTIHGHFSPTAVGSLTAAVTIVDNAVGSPHSIPLSGIGSNTTATLSATSLAFGSELVGTTSASQQVTLTNTGSATLSITSIGLTGTGASSFMFANSCGTSLAAGASCTIHGHFTPAAMGAQAAAITITDTATGSPQSIKVTGTGVTAPAVSLSATSLMFGSQAVDTTSASQQVTMTNIGGTTLSISSIGVTGANASSFMFANNCGTSLAPGASCSIHGHFTPTAVGALTAAVTITDNASGSPQSIALTGTGH